MSAGQIALVVVTAWGLSWWFLATRPFLCAVFIGFMHARIDRRVGPGGGTAVVLAFMADQKLPPIAGLSLGARLGLWALRRAVRRVQSAPAEDGYGEETLRRTVAQLDSGHVVICMHGDGGHAPRVQRRDDDELPPPPPGE